MYFSAQSSIKNYVYKPLYWFYFYLNSKNTLNLNQGIITNSPKYTRNQMNSQ